MSGKTLVSLRIDSKNVENADMMAIHEDRSRNYIVNRLLNQMITNLEKKHGEITVKHRALEKFRRKRRNRGIAQAGGVKADQRKNDA